MWLQVAKMRHISIKVQKITKNKKNLGASKNDLDLNKNSEFVAAFCLVTAYN